MLHSNFLPFLLESNDANEPKQLKYRCNTTKTLEMTRVFLVEKEKEREKEQEQEQVTAYSCE